MENIIRESAFDEKKKKPGLKFIPRLALTGVRTSGPKSLLPAVAQIRHMLVNDIFTINIHGSLMEIWACLQN